MIDDALMEVRAGAMRSLNHSLIMRAYAYGQYRVQLTRVDLVDPHAPYGHGAIVRELCTYRRDVAYAMTASLAAAPDPEQACRDLERPWNCEWPGRGRIRLDNKPDR